MSGQTLYLDWGGDLLLNQNGGLQLAVGWDYIRQFILRQLLTNAADVLPNGIKVAPDYLFDAGYGIGLPRKVGGAYSDGYLAELRARISQAVLSSSDVNPSNPPNVSFSRPDPSTLIVLVNFLLSNGAPGQIALKVS